MTKCPKCGRELSENEKTNGKCNGCGIIFQEITPNTSQKQNNKRYTELGLTMQILGGIIIGIGLISSLIYGSESGSFVAFIVSLCGGVISGLFIMGFGEIINLLYSIEQKMNK